MEKIYQAKFIGAGAPYGDVCTVFKKEFLEIEKENLRKVITKQTVENSNE